MKGEVPQRGDVVANALLTSEKGRKSIPLASAPLALDLRAQVSFLNVSIPQSV